MCQALLRLTPVLLRMIPRFFIGDHVILRFWSKPFFCLHAISLLMEAQLHYV